MLAKVDLAGRMRVGVNKIEEANKGCWRRLTGSFVKTREERTGKEKAGTRPFLAMESPLRSDDTNFLYIIYNNRNDLPRKNRPAKENFLRTPDQ
jgi:hypothetical protein